MEIEDEEKRWDYSDPPRNPISIIGNIKLLRYYIKTAQSVWGFGQQKPSHLADIAH